MIGPVAIFDVRKFGATGDGTTDDTTAIRAAVTAALAAEPCVIHFPRGTYVVNDATTGSNGGIIRITAGNNGIHIRGDNAVLKIGSTGVGESVVRIFADRCEVSGLIVDVNANLGSDSSARKALDNTGFEINDGDYNYIHHCQYINGYTGDTIQTQGSSGFLIVNGDKNHFDSCYAENCTWQGFRVGGTSAHTNYITNCACVGQRGNALRVIEQQALYVDGFVAYSVSNPGRSAVLLDPGSAAGSTKRCDLFVMTNSWLYCNPPNGTGGASNTMKIASTTKTIIRDSYIGCGAAQGNYAVRIEDSAKHVTLEHCRIDPNFHIAPGGTADEATYQGLVTSIADNGSGKCRITLTGTGTGSVFSANGGKSLFVNGSSDSAYNREHRIQAVNPSGAGAYVVDTDIDFVTSTIGSACFARTGIDTLIVKNCQFGNDSIVDDGNLDTPMMQYLSPRVLVIEDSTFTQLWTYDATPTAYSAIDWSTNNDAGFDLIRLVNNDFSFRTNTGLVAQVINCDSNTCLVTSGKIVSHSNRIRNVGTGSVIMADTGSSNSNANRQILFSTEGENPRRFRFSGTPNATDVATIFNVGDVIYDTAINAERVFTVAGTSGSTASTYFVRGGTYRCRSTSAGSAVANTTTETSATPSSVTGSLQFGGTRALAVGERFRMQAGGTYSTTGTPTLTIRAKVGKVSETGATNLGVLAFTTPSGAASLKWRLDVTGEAITIGASGVIRATGTIAYETATDTWTTFHIAPTDVTVNTSNTSHNRKLDVSIQWGTANAANTATCTIFDTMPLQ